MRKVMLFIWLLLPVVAVAYHYGPGQDDLRADDAGAAVERIKAAAAEARTVAAAQGDDAARSMWADVEVACSEALDLLPADRVAEGRAIRLERAKALMFISGLPEARRDLQVLVDEVASDREGDPALLTDARSTLASAQYYNTWLQRLEGAPREEWEREIEASRQNFKLVAEQHDARGDSALATSAREDLEASIRLARMDLAELQGLPLPSQ